MTDTWVLNQDPRMTWSSKGGTWPATSLLSLLPWSSCTKASDVLELIEFRFCLCSESLKATKTTGLTDISYGYFQQRNFVTPSMAQPLCFLNSISCLPTVIEIFATALISSSAPLTYSSKPLLPPQFLFLGRILTISSQWELINDLYNCSLHWLLCSWNSPLACHKL